MKKTFVILAVSMMMLTTVYAQDYRFDSLTINNVKAILYSTNKQFLGEVADKFIFPKDGNTSTIFANTLWIGGRNIYNQLRISAEVYNQIGSEFQPGPMGQNAGLGGRWNRVWKLSVSEIQDFIHASESGTVDENQVPEAIKTWPAHGNVADGEAQNLAPFFDKNGDGIYNWQNGDYPLIKGDQCIFYIINDVRNIDAGPSSIGVEIHVMAYAFGDETNPAFWNSMFFNYKLHNRSVWTLYDTYIGNWCDLDIGYGLDDFIGCDVERGMFYGYNGLETDGSGQPGTYGNRIPAQGIVILGGALLPADGLDNPKVNIEKMRLLGDETIIAKLTTSVTEGGYAIYDQDDNFVKIDTIALTNDAELYKDYWYYENDLVGSNAINGARFGDGIADNERMGMTGFMFHENDNSVIGDPQAGKDFYNLLRNRWKDNTPLYYSSSQDILCNYAYPGNSDRWNCGTHGIPVEAWEDENAPGDRRGVGISGPFTFAAGDVFEFDIALVAAFGEDNTIAGGIAQLQTYVDTIRKAFLFAEGKFENHGSGIASYVPQKENISVYPNPTTGKITIKTDGRTIPQVKLYSLQGQLLYKTTDNQIDISHLTNGIYILQVNNRAVKIVKQ